MAKPWTECWPEVRAAVRGSQSRLVACEKVSAIRGLPVTWDALARQWRRMVENGQEAVSADQMLAAESIVLSVEGDTLHFTVGQTIGFPARERPRPPARTGPKHGIIGDTQLRPEDDLCFLEWIARYFADKRPEVVVQLGDWADMASLSSYDSKAKKAVDQRSVRDDFEVANRGWRILDEIWKAADYNPRKVYVMGNHEARIERFVADNPELAGDVNYDRFVAAELGWEVYPFLQPVVIDGVAYAHFFPRGPHGRVTQTKNGPPNAVTMIKREMRSCTAGHMQGKDVGTYDTSDRTLRGVILGSSYLHDEGYLSPQGNRHWRGVLLKHSVCDGDYDLVEVPLDYLEKKYG